MKAKNPIPTHQRWMLSAWIRDKNHKGEVPTIQRDYPERVFGSIPSMSLDERIAKFLIRLGQSSKYAGDIVEIKPEFDHPLYWMENRDEVWWLVDELDRAGLVIKDLSSGHADASLTIMGWREVRRLQQETSESEQIFVAMWFDPSMDRLFEHGIKAAIESSDVGYKAFRIDLKEHTGKIDDAIILEIRRSRAVVADFTEDRGGVYFEAGFALGLDKPVIWSCRADKISTVHFDTRQYNHIVWDNPEDLRVKLIRRILALDI